MKCSWAPGWCWSQAKGNWERERRLTQAEMWGWRLTGCWGFTVWELPLGASQPTVSEQGAAAQRGSGKATNTHTQDKTMHRDDWDLFYFEGQAYFIFKALLQGHQLILRLIEAETKISAQCRFCFIWFILNIHPGVFTRALCVFMKIFFSLVFDFFDFWFFCAWGRGLFCETYISIL